MACCGAGAPADGGAAARVGGYRHRPECSAKQGTAGEGLGAKSVASATLWDTGWVLLQVWARPVHLKRLCTRSRDMWRVIAGACNAQLKVHTSSSF